MAKNVLVTGVNGFVGKHLVRELAKQGHHAFGVGLEKQAHPEIAALLDNYYVADLTSPESVLGLPLQNFNAVISLAGLAKVGASFAEAEKYKKINVEVLSVLSEEILAKKQQIRVIAISTGAVYDPSQEMPFTEDSKLAHQASPYAISKMRMEEAAQKLRSRGLRCVVVRPFNHIGPGQEPGFLLPDLYQKIQASLKSGEPIKVGDLTTKRDYTDVRDVVRAYTGLATADSVEFELFNVCSGKSVAGQTILTALLDAMGAGGKVRVEQDQSLIRPNDPKDLYGSNQRINQATGWQPQIPLDQTIRDFVTAEQNKV